MTREAQTRIARMHPAMTSSDDRTTAGSMERERAVAGGSVTPPGVRRSRRTGWFLSRRPCPGVPQVMERLRRLRAGISHHDSAHRFSRDLGVDVFIGKGVFTSANTVEVRLDPSQ